MLIPNWILSSLFTVLYPSIVDGVLAKERRLLPRPTSHCLGHRADAYLCPLNAQSNTSLPTQLSFWLATAKQTNGLRRDWAQDSVT